MLTREENELLTRVGPGTPMGEVFRRYWIVAGSYLFFGAINLFAMASGFGWGHRTAHRESLEPAR